jgi:hypothetical protein
MRTCRVDCSSLLGDTPMTRRARGAHWADGACYHILNRGHNRESIFADDGDRRYFLSLCRATKSESAFVFTITA